MQSVSNQAQRHMGTSVNNNKNQKSGLIRQGINIHAHSFRLCLAMLSRLFVNVLYMRTDSV